MAARGFNVAFISTRSYFFQQQLTTPPHPPVLAFLAPVLLNFLQLQYQGKGFTPFQTNPKTMWVAITSLLLYCLAYDAELRFPLDHRAPSYARVISRGRVSFGWLFSVSLASILFPYPIGVVLYSVYAMFLATKLVHRKIMPAFANRGGLLPL